MALGPLVLARDQDFILVVRAWHTSPARQWSSENAGNTAHLFGEIFHSATPITSVQWPQRGNTCRAVAV